MEDISYNSTMRFNPSNPSAFGKYRVIGADGKHYSTDDVSMLPLLGGISCDCRYTPGGISYSLAIMPDDQQPTGGVNWPKFSTNVDVSFS